MSSLTLGSNNEPFLDWMWHVMESGFYTTTCNDQFNGWPKKKLQSTFQNLNLHQKIKGSWALFGGLLPDLIHYSFASASEAIASEKLLSKSMRCTENCNTCSWRWSTERAQLVSMTTLDCMLQNQATKASKVEQIELRTLASSATFIWPLTNLLQVRQASWWLFTGKQASTTSRRQKMLCKRILWIPKHGCLYCRNKQTYFSLAKIVHCNGSYFE